MKWILNSGRKDNTTNENKMLSLNRGFIGFGTPEEKREEKKSYTTIKQYENIIYVKKLIFKSLLIMVSLS